MVQNDIVQKLWSLCDILRDDGINYSNYVTELVLLLFIKMVHENEQAGIDNRHILPSGCQWSDLTDKMAWFYWKRTSGFCWHFQRAKMHKGTLFILIH